MSLPLRMVQNTGDDGGNDLIDSLLGNIRNTPSSDSTDSSSSIDAFLSSLQPTDYSSMLEMDYPDVDFSGVTMPDVSLVDFDSLVGGLSGTAGQVVNDSVRQALGLAGEASDANAGRVSAAFDAAIGQTAAGARTLSQTLFDTQRALLDQATPGWREQLQGAADLSQQGLEATTAYLAANLPTMMQQGGDIAEAQGKLVKSLLAGEVPDDVAKQISRRAAETAESFGIFGGASGGAGRALEARDLGLSSLQMQAFGAALAKDSAALWSAPAMEAANAIQSAQKSVGGVAELFNAFGLKPDVNANQMFAQAFDANVKATTVSPDTVFNNAMSQYNSLMGWGVDIAKSNQQAQAQYDSMALQFQTDRMNAEVALASGRMTTEATLRAAAIDARSTENAALASAYATMFVGREQANATRFSAAANANAVTNAAAIGAAATVGAAQLSANASVEAAGIGANATMGAAAIAGGKWGASGDFISASPGSKLSKTTWGWKDDNFVATTTKGYDAFKY